MISSYSTGCQPAQAGFPAARVVGAFDPGDDRNPQLLTSRPHAIPNVRCSMRRWPVEYASSGPRFLKGTTIRLRLVLIRRMVSPRIRIRGNGNRARCRAKVQSPRFLSITLTKKHAALSTATASDSPANTPKTGPRPRRPSRTAITSWARRGGLDVGAGIEVGVGVAAQHTATSKAYWHYGLQLRPVSGRPDRRRIQTVSAYAAPCSINAWGHTAALHDVTLRTAQFDRRQDLEESSPGRATRTQ